MNSAAVGIDIAKNVFQVNYIDHATGENREPVDQAGAVSPALRKPGPLPDQHGSVRQCAPLRPAHEDEVSVSTSVDGAMSKINDVRWTKYNGGDKAPVVVSERLVDSPLRRSCRTAVTGVNVRR